MPKKNRNDMRRMDDDDVLKARKLRFIKGETGKQIVEELDLNLTPRSINDAIAGNTYSDVPGYPGYTGEQPDWWELIKQRYKHKHKKIIDALKDDHNKDDKQSDNEESDVTIREPDKTRDYAYLEKFSLYRFEVDGKIVEYPKEIWEKICWLYSDEGAGLTAAEVARRFGIDTTILRACLRKYGQFKASPDKTKEVIKAAAKQGNIEELAEESIELQEKAYLEKKREKELRKTKREWRELKDEERQRRKTIEELKDVSEKIDVPKDIEVQKALGLRELIKGIESGKASSVDPDGTDLEPNEAIVIPGESDDGWISMSLEADPHAGLMNWAKASFGKNFDTDIVCGITKNAGMLHAQYIYKRSITEGPCKRNIHVCLGDKFHGLPGETDKGTPMEQDSRWEKIWWDTLIADLWVIEQKRRVAEKVDIFLIPGNHDGKHLFAYATNLYWAYKQTDDVEVHLDPMLYQYVRVRDALHVFDHGKGVGKLTGWKAQAQAEQTARNIAGLDYTETEYIYSYYGHKHDEEVATAGPHHKLIRLDALAATDDFATELRYHNEPSSTIISLDHKGRHKNTELFHEDELRNGLDLDG